MLRRSRARCQGVPRSNDEKSSADALIDLQFMSPHQISNADMRYACGYRTVVVHPKVSHYDTLQQHVDATRYGALALRSMEAESSGRFMSTPATRGFAALEDALRVRFVRLVRLVRLARVRDGVVAPVVVLPIVGLLLLALILITAGCGPPN